MDVIADYSTSDHDLTFLAHPLPCVSLLLLTPFSSTPPTACPSPTGIPKVNPQGNFLYLGFTIFFLLLLFLFFLFHLQQELSLRLI